MKPTTGQHLQSGLPVSFLKMENRDGKKIGIEISASFTRYNEKLCGLKGEIIKYAGFSANQLNELIDHKHLHRCIMAGENERYPSQDFTLNIRQGFLGVLCKFQTRLKEGKSFYDELTNLLNISSKRIIYSFGKIKPNLSGAYDWTNHAGFSPVIHTYQSNRDYNLCLTQNEKEGKIIFDAKLTKYFSIKGLHDIGGKLERIGISPKQTPFNITQYEVITNLPELPEKP